MFVQNSLYPILTFVGVIFSINQGKDTPKFVNTVISIRFWYIAPATSCHVYPSEYAYKSDTVTRTESASANCRRYPVISLKASIHSRDYIHCDGTSLKLADANPGSEQFNISNHYQWPAGSDGQLLFIFPTRVSLTTITLHYYSDSVRGRPRLRFYAVRNDFDAWDTPTTNTPRVDVASIPAGGEPAGRKSVNIIFNFNTTKVLMYKYSAAFQFAVSEVDFRLIICKQYNLILNKLCDKFITSIYAGQVPIGTTSTAVTEISTSSESASKATNVVTKSTTFNSAKGKYNAHNIGILSA